MEIPDRTSMAMRLTFEFGHGVHHVMQNNPSILGNKLLGYWKCGCCGKLEFGQRPSLPCRNCEASPSLFSYDEYAFKLKEPWRLSGHIDALYRITPGNVRLMDFKTIGPNEFSTLSEPKAEHKIQLHGYWLGWENDPKAPIRVNPDFGYILYVAKTHTPSEIPFKAFVVKRSLEIENVLVKELTDFSNGVNSETHVVAVRKSCADSNHSCRAARNCRVRAKCAELMRLTAGKGSR